MKRRPPKAILSFFIAFIFCCGLFLGLSFIVLHGSQNRKETVSAPESAVAAAQTEAFCVQLDAEGKQYILDIKPQQSAAFLEPIKTPYAEQADRTVTADKTLLRGLCEALGGIEYTENGRRTRLTGQHFIDRYDAADFDSLFKLLLTKAFQSRETLSITYSFLAENNATNISYVDFYENAESLIGIRVN